jgi:hypothetical protein
MLFVLARRSMRDDAQRTRLPFQDLGVCPGACKKSEEEKEESAREH